jgi:hypothetical protein
MDQRANTVKVQLPEGSIKPMDVEMLKFVIVTLNLKSDEVCGVSQNPGNDGIIYIKCYREETMKMIIDTFNGAMFKYENGTVVKVTISEANENIKYVRIFGLPFEVDDKDIEAFFAHFGKVKRLVKERFPAHFNFDVLSGVRGIYIDLKKEIPALLYLRGCRVKIHYYGMKEKCHICGSSEHMRSECPSRPAAVTPAGRVEQMTNLNELFKKPAVQHVQSPSVQITPQSVGLAVTTSQSEPKTSGMTSFNPYFSPSGNPIPATGFFGYTHNYQQKVTENPTITTTTISTPVTSLPPAQPASVFVQPNEQASATMETINMETDDETDEEKIIECDINSIRVETRAARKARKSPTPDKGAESRDNSSDSKASTSSNGQKKSGQPKRQKVLQTIANANAHKNNEQKAQQKK